MWFSRSPATDASRRQERGATGLEYAGMIVAAALVVGAISLAMTQTNVAGRTAYAICQLLQQENCTPVQGAEADKDWESGNFVPLGDSFASGEGAGGYRDGTNYDNRDDWDPRNWGNDDHNRCRRSQSSYAELVYNDPDFNFGGKFIPRYCSGAEMEEMENPNDKQDFEPPQLDDINEDTSLVTMSIGGNDVGFSKVLTDCVVNGERGVPGIPKCQAKWNDQLNTDIAALEEDLVKLYSKIRGKAPNARVIIMGYPPLFNDPPSESLNNMLFAEDQVWMNGKADQLNAMLERAARRAGVEFINPTEAFRGHGVGAPDGQQWINDLDWGGPGISLTDPGSFHPNAQGHAAMAELLKKQLRDPQYN